MHVERIDGKRLNYTTAALRKMQKDIVRKRNACLMVTFNGFMYSIHKMIYQSKESKCGCRPVVDLENPDVCLLRRLQLSIQKGR